MRQSASLSVYAHRVCYTLLAGVRASAFYVHTHLSSSKCRLQTVFVNLLSLEDSSINHSRMWQGLGLVSVYIEVTKSYCMYYYVQLTTGMIVRSKVPFSFDENGWSANIDVATRLSNDHADPSYGFYTTVNFSFRREYAVAYWGN